MQIQRIKSIKKIGIRNTLDFKVNSPFHNFYAEGILVSNSHAYAYSYLTAITTYYKANYPLQFFVSLLRMTKNEPSPLQEITTIQKELIKFNIELLPPNIKESGEDFKIQGKNIRFGVGSIKGISNAAIKKLISFNREYSTKFDLFNNCLESKLGLNVVKSLIHAGCFPDYNNTRAKLQLEFEVFNILTDRERLLVNRLAQQFNEDLFSILKYLTNNKDTDGKVYVKESRLNTIKKDYEKYRSIYDFNKKHGKLLNVLYEYEVLGYSYSGSLAACYKEEYPEIVSLYEAITSLKGEANTFIARIKSTKEGRSRAKQTPYVKMELVDEQSEVIAMIFSDKINQVKDSKGKIIKEDVIIVCNGRKMDENTFFLNWAKPLFDLKLAKRVSDTE